MFADSHRRQQFQNCPGHGGWSAAACRISGWAVGRTGWSPRFQASGFRTSRPTSQPVFSQTARHRPSQPPARPAPAGVVTQPASARTWRGLIPFPPARGARARRLRHHQPVLGKHLVPLAGSAATSAAGLFLAPARYGRHRGGWPGLSEAHGSRIPCCDASAGLPPCTTASANISTSAPCGKHHNSPPQPTPLTSDLQLIPTRTATPAFQPFPNSNSHLISHPTAALPTETK